jgi:fructokinase
MSSLPAFVGAGEAVADLLTTGPGTWTRRTGGSTWNVARAVARLVRPDGCRRAAAPRVEVVDTVGTAACRVAGAQPPALDAVLALAEDIAVRREDALDFQAADSQYLAQQ